MYKYICIYIYKHTNTYIGAITYPYGGADNHDSGNTMDHYDNGNNGDRLRKENHTTLDKLFRKMPQLVKDKLY